MYVCMSVNLDYYRWRNDDGVNLWRRMLDWIGDIWMICGWFHLDITHISRYHPHIYQISPTYHPDIIHISPTYHPDITHISSIYHPHILQISHGQYFLQPPNLVKSQVLTQIWHDYCRKNSTLKSHHPDITQISSKYHPEIIQKSSRNHPEIIQKSSRSHQKSSSQKLSSGYESRLHQERMFSGREPEDSFYSRTPY